MSSQAGTSGERPQATFPGHPLGLYVLFFTEMWERFSYYGMRALLILYMVKYFLWSQADASGIYKVYTSLVYLTPILGGYLADRYLGNRLSVILGAFLMAVGHFLMAFETLWIFYSALGFLILGNGFFKPNAATQVGRLYPTNDDRRDGAYTIFYMGVNLGAFLAPLVCGWLADNTVGGFHTGFTAAGIGMVLGLITYVVGMGWIKELNPADKPPAKTDAAISEEQASVTPSLTPLLNRIAPSVLLVVGLLFSLIVIPAFILVVLLSQGTDLSQPPWLIVKPLAVDVSLGGFALNVNVLMYGMIAIGALLSSWVLYQTRNAVRDRVLTIYVLGIFVIFFWAAFEQAGNAMNLWADMHTNRFLAEAVPPPPSVLPETLSVPTADEIEAAGGQGILGRFTGMWKLKPRPDGVATAAWYNPVPTAWFQSINALAIFVLAPFFAFLWTYLAEKNIKISIPVKMALGVFFQGLAFALMIWCARLEDGPTVVPYANKLPDAIHLDDQGRLSERDAKTGVLHPYQAGRLRYDAQKKELQMTGVLPDIERDRIVRDTAPAGYHEALLQLQKKTETGQGRTTESVVLAEIPAGWDLKYSGFPPQIVSLDRETRTLTVKNFQLADQHVKALLVSGGDPEFRDAVNKLFVESASHRVCSWCLFWFYIFCTIGELCISPVGLSMVSKLAPAKFATMLMGLYYLTNALANYAAGALGETWGSVAPIPYFVYTTVAMAGAALVCYLIAGKVTKMMHGVN